MKTKIAVLGSGWAFDFINAVLTGLKEATKNTHTDIYYFTCYKFHNPDTSLNSTGYKIYDLINIKEFDSFVILANLFEDEAALSKIVERIQLANKPVVTLVRKIEGIPCISADNYIGFYNLISHLIEEHKVRNIAYIGGIQNDIQNQDRYRAFETALHDHYIGLTESMVYETGDWSFKFGFEKGLELFKRKLNRPDAIVCSNDTEAYGVIRAAIECNVKIPEEVKIIGFDNDSLSERTIPSLSTVDTKVTDMGIQAYKKLQEYTKNNDDIIIASEPVIRQSCGCHQSITAIQKNHSLRTLLVQDEEERFTAHLRHTEDVFINDDNVYMVWDACQKFYNKRHFFEGEDFSILLRKELFTATAYQDDNFDDIELGDQLTPLVNLQAGNIIKPEPISTDSLLPTSMLSKENNTYIFLPIVFHNNFFGYYCTKNNLRLLFNKRGYSWAKNMANSIAKFREKTKYRLLSQKYLGLSTKDALSDVYNRTALDLFANEIYETNRHSDYYTAIYFIDINDMKAINDLHGHLHGDMAIKIVADELKNTIPDKWMIIRYGGDEFVIIGTCDKNYQDILSDFNKKLENSCNRMSLPYRVSASIGLGLVPPDSVNSLTDEINKVDEIMYEHKKEYHRYN